MPQAIRDLPGQIAVSGEIQLLKFLQLLQRHRDRPRQLIAAER